jgi:hypothetical protein
VAEGTEFVIFPPEVQSAATALPMPTPQQADTMAHELITGVPKTGVKSIRPQAVVLNSTGVAAINWPVEGGDPAAPTSAWAQVSYKFNVALGLPPDTLTVEQTSLDTKLSDPVHVVSEPPLGVIPNVRAYVPVRVHAADPVVAGVIVTGTTQRHRPAKAPLAMGVEFSSDGVSLVIDATCGLPVPAGVVMNAPEPTALIHVIALVHSEKIVTWTVAVPAASTVAVWLVTSTVVPKSVTDTDDSAVNCVGVVTVNW